MKLRKWAAKQLGITYREISTMAGDRKAVVCIASSPDDSRWATARRLVEARHELRAFVAQSASS